MSRIRFALRSLRKAPLFCLAVVLSLGLGIGANTAVFSLLHQVVLGALPVPRPDELALLRASSESRPATSPPAMQAEATSCSTTPFFASWRSTLRAWWV